MATRAKSNTDVTPIIVDDDYYWSYVLTASVIHLWKWNIDEIYSAKENMENDRVVLK